MAKVNSNDMDHTMIQPNVNIKNLILTVRDVQVLLDSDVAILYGYETKSINLAARRNIDRFPSEFRFQLTSEEAARILKSQTVTSSEKEILKFHFETSSYENNMSAKTHGGRRKLPYVYTEHGIIMLAGILRNKTAVEVSINITKAFVEMRRFINTNRDVFAKMVSIDNKLLEHDLKFDEVFDLLQQPEVIRQNIFFKGQFYDAFTLVNGVIKIIASNDFHDRFIILDHKEVYAFGASLKDLGKKCFEVSKSEDPARFISYMKGII